LTRIGLLILKLMHIPLGLKKSGGLYIFQMKGNVYIWNTTSFIKSLF